MNNNKYLFIHFFSFVSKVMRKLRFPVCMCVWYNTVLHHIIYLHLLPYLKKAKYMILQNVSCKNEYNNGIIWVFWWQGYSNMPQIVAACVDSIERNSNGHPVILITKNNVKKYTNIPQYIYRYLNKGNITFTHFSDILRFNLLKNYGGLWLDSTIYCTSKIPKKFSDFYTSGGYSNKYNFFISSKWTGFVIGGAKDIPIFIFMNNFFKLYWATHSHLIDYFLIDYALYYVYNTNISNFNKYVNNVAYKNNPHLHELQKLLNLTYNNNIYNKLTKDTNLFKLTYKSKFKNNGKTFYSRLIN